MSNQYPYKSVSKEIEIEGIPVMVSALFWPEEEKVTNITTRVTEENPDDQGGLWEVSISGDVVVLCEGGRIPGHLYTRYEEKIEQAAEEAAQKASE